MKKESQQSQDQGAAPSIQAALDCAASLSREGFNPPPWEDLLSEEPEPSREKPGLPRKGWQKLATELVEARHLRCSVRPQLTDTEAALLRSQAGPMASAALTAIPSKKEFRLAPQPFRILLLRRLRPPLPLSACRCGRPFDVLGHHRAACGTAGVLGQSWLGPGERRSTCVSRGRRTCSSERPCARHGPPRVQPARWTLEVVVDGLPLWNGAQLAIDTTVVSPVRSDGTVRAGTASIKGKALDVAKARKARRYPELSGEHGRARLVVLVTEVGGRWSKEAATFLCSLATAKARDAPFALGGSVRAAWLRRWQGMLESLLEGPAMGGVDGPTPSTNDVLGDARFG